MFEYVYVWVDGLTWMDGQIMAELMHRCALGCTDGRMDERMGGLIIGGYHIARTPPVA